MDKSDSASRIQLEIPAQLKYLGTITACVRSVLDRVDCVDLADSVRAGIELAVHEACVNIILHAYRDTTGRIWMTLTLSESPCQLEVRLRDTGKSGTLEEMGAPEPGELREQGYGLFLMKQIMDSVEYFPNDGDNRWRLVKNF